jgi:hypothetical protein
MSEVFSVRSLIYWWAALSTTIFLKDWLKLLAEFVRKPGMFIRDKFPFNFVPGVNSWIDGAAEYIRARVGFNPTQPLLTAPIMVPSWIIAILFAAILVGIGVALYIRALRTASWFDDFITLTGIYVLLRMVGHTVAIASLPLLDQFRDFVNNPTTSLVVLIILLLALIFFGEGFQSRKAFWRAMVEGAIIAIFMFPSETANGIGYLIQAFANLGTSLAEPANAPFAILWGVIGMALAVQRLTGREHPNLTRG